MSASASHAARFVHFALAASLCACGAKTGLNVPELPPGDAGMDTYVPPRPSRCIAQRLRTQVGARVPLRPSTDGELPTSGLRWTLTSSPSDSLATVATDGSPAAAITPDRAGEYSVRVDIPTPLAPSGTLACTIVVVADAPNVRCPGYTVIEPQVVSLGDGGPRVAMDTRLRDPGTTRAGSTVLLRAEDPDAVVAVFAFARPAHSTLADATRALTDDAVEIERSLERDVVAEPILVGRTGQTREGNPNRRSLYQIGAVRRTDITTVRDRVAGVLTGAPTPERSPGGTDADGAFYIDVSFVLDARARSLIVLVAMSSVRAFNDGARPTSVRSDDFVNTSGLTTGAAEPVVVCEAFVASRTPRADFLWFVDTSRSMDDDQERVGATAAQFFDRARIAGVDFRVGVFQAGASTPILDAARSFSWIPGADPNGARTMAYQVTRVRYRNARDDTLHPFSVMGEEEEPVAAALLAIREFERRRAAGERNPEFVLRADAVRAVFFVTDEPGNNDDERYFELDTATWGATPAARIRTATDFFVAHRVIPFGLVRYERLGDCVSGAVNFAPCVATLGGGAFVPIDLPRDSAEDTAFQTAMLRVVDVAVAAASEFVLPREPISAALSVQLDTVAVPRSRVDGVDFDARTHALVFRGARWVPRVGQSIRTAYLAWP